ncbi:putative quinol oxidase subunit [Burkholderiales bacterium]|nr:putative quinol oxidase subunit [Burkholderiales bacterium]
MPSTVLNFSELAGRVLLAVLFLIAGIGKISGYAATQGYMASQGVPGALLPLVIATELGGGALIVIGLWTRWVAVALAGFTLLAAILFHGNSSDQMQQIMFLKDVSIAGAFLLLVANGAGAWSVDARRARASR